MSLWDVLRYRYSDLGNGFTEQALDSLARRIIPPSERDASAWRQGSDALCDSKFRLGKMSKPKGADHRVEHVIEKWEMFYVCLTIFYARMQLVCQLYHPWGQVNARSARAALCCLCRKSTGPARDIQQICAGMQMYGVEKRLGS
nr:hypothetical protein [Bradyrhizobium ivorense]